MDGCAKIHGSHAIVGLTNLVPSYHRPFVGCFVGPRFFLVGISWVQNIFSWVFMDPNFFLLDILWVEFFFLRLIS